MSDRYEQTLRALKQKGRLRTLQPLSGRSGGTVTSAGQTLLNLSSNDYLGLAGNVALHEAFYQRLEGTVGLDEFGLGAASSRLLSGDNEVMHLLEDELARAYGYPAALLYNSGYHANIGVLPALFGKHDLIVSDKLNHASIHDGLHLSLADHKRYTHCDYTHLAAILDRHRQHYERVVIVSESVFSMDGDVADLQQLVRLKNQYDCMLYIDEAHGVGLYGAHGLGQAEQQKVLTEIDLFIGTFGKALASVGAFVLCSRTIREYLVNHSRSLMFTTAMAPVNVSWNRFVFQHMLGMNRERGRLMQLGEKLRESLVAAQLQTCGSTNIVPVILGDDQLAIHLSEHLREKGFLVMPVRPPTVPKNTARFRLSLTSDMRWQDLAPLAGIIAAASHDISQFSA